MECVRSEMTHLRELKALLKVVEIFSLIADEKKIETNKGFMNFFVNLR